MFNPIRLVDNNFEDDHLSNANLRAFTEDHLVRLAQPENNPGSIYSTLLTDTTTKYTAYYGKMTSQAVKEAIGEGATITRNNARTAAQEKIRSLEALTIFKFGEGSAEYQELFPLGFTEYVHAREGDIGGHFDRFVVAATTHLTADFPLEVTAISDLVTAFHSAYTARETVVSQVDVLITGKNSDRVALTVQLTVNFLIIASDHVGNPDKYQDYFDPRFLPIETGDAEATLANKYNLLTILVPAGGSVIVPLTPGTLIPTLDIYARALNGTVWVCTTDLPANPCSAGYKLVEQKTFHGPLSGMPLDFTKTELQITNPSLSDVTVKIGPKKEEEEEE